MRASISHIRKNHGPLQTPAQLLDLAHHLHRDETVVRTFSQNSSRSKTYRVVHEFVYAPYQREFVKTFAWLAFSGFALKRVSVMVHEDEVPPVICIMSDHVMYPTF